MTGLPRDLRMLAVTGGGVLCATGLRPLTGARSDGDINEVALNGGSKRASDMIENFINR